ncbi:MAG: reductive dehalogenase [Desulfosarcinaceae bacterium]|nr:reductive dehalogenase [Desulfosarcinaceae bacterium]
MINSRKKDRLNAGFSRRRFLGMMGMATGALAAGCAYTPVRDTKTERIGSALDKSGVNPPAFEIKKLNSTAEQTYKCKPELGRFDQKNMAFKQVSMEIGAPFFEPLIENLERAVKDSHIGHGVKVKSMDEARAHLAFSFGAGTWNNMVGPYGEGHENMGNLSWNPLFVPKDLYEHPLQDPDPADLTKKVKQMARLFGADMTKIGRINRNWIYATTCRNIPKPGKPITKPIVFKDVTHPEESESELVIPQSVKNAIMFVVAMPHASTQLGPSTTQTMGSVGIGYGRMGLTAVALAEAIRSMGYNAIPSMNGTGLSVPMAIDAGLGQLGRMGYMITPWFGPHVRIAKVLTDMPLVKDAPIDFGVTEYCTSCGICAKECPSGAISPDRERTFTPSAPTGNPGALKWYTDGKKCLRWWIESGSSGCAKCMSVCPYTKMQWSDYYQGNPDPERFWDLELAPFGYRSIGI